jgi:hypothetical protein
VQLRPTADLRLDEARFLRVRCRIPAGEEWTFASGVMPEFGLGGRA